MSSLTPTNLRRRAPLPQSWRQWLLACAAIYFLFFGTTGLYNRINARPDLRDNLLITPPESLTVAFQNPPFAPPVTWLESTAPVLFDEPITRLRISLVSFAHRAQFSNHNALEINQMVIDVGGSTQALWQFIRAQPGAYDSAATFTPLTLNYRSSVADQQRAACDYADQNHCFVAYTWARYGQYIVRIRLGTDGQPIETSNVSLLFKQVDQHIAQALQSN